MARTARWLIVIGVLASLAGSATAQSGGIDVLVLDDEGAPLPSALVEISSELQYVKATSLSTDRSGRVSFPVLRPGGGYAITVSFPGFSPIRQSGIRIAVNQRLQLQVRMFEEIRESVRVTATRRPLELERSHTSTRFTDEYFDALPVPGRFYQSALTLAPGVQDADDDGNPNVHGARARDFKASVGGISNVDPLTGQWMSRVNPNSIEELEVVTAGAGVEFGRAQGGFARIIQKQGSNVHEGVFEFHYRTSAFERRVDEFSGLPESKLRWTQPALQLSGPLLRDRLWYRFSHELLHVREPTPGLSGETAAIDGATHADQLTWQASPRNKLAFRYQADPREAENFGISVRSAPGSGQRRTGGGEGYSLTWTAPFSPRLLVESIVGWQALESGIFPAEPGVSNECLRSPLMLARAQCTDLDTRVRSGSYFRVQDDRSQRFTLDGRVTLHRHSGRADQRFKFGFAVENERYFRRLERNPTLDTVIVGVGEYDPTGTFAGPAFFPYGVGYFRVPVPAADEARATGTNWSLYLEDQISVRNDLVITLGARIDREELNSQGKGNLDPQGEYRRFVDAVTPFLSNPVLFDRAVGQTWPMTFTAFEALDDYSSELQRVLCAGLTADFLGNCRQFVVGTIQSQQQAQAHNQRRSDDIELYNTNVSPSFALAWSPGPDGKTALKLSAGRHFGAIPLVIPLQEQEPSQSDMIVFFDLVDREGFLLSGINPAQTVRTVDRGLRTPYQDELLLAFERELWPETSLQLSYIRRKFRDQLQDTDINVITGDFGSCRDMRFRGDLAVVASPGHGQAVVDPYTFQEYLDTDPGNGDGRIDDCAGEREFVIRGGSFFDAARPDRIPDLYKQNFLWGDILEISNSNVIDYTAYQLELVRRRYRDWELQASYTWSEAIGDGEDFQQELGDDPALLRDVAGYQSYDQRHVVKLNATTITPWGLRFGAALSWQSGLPYSIVLDRNALDSVPPLLAELTSASPRIRRQYRDIDGPLPRNSGRNEAWWNIDLKAVKELNFGKRVNLQLSAEVFNVLDERTYQIYDPLLAAGQQVNGINEAIRRPGRRWQSGMKLSF